MLSAADAGRFDDHLAVMAGLDFLHRAVGTVVPFANMMAWGHPFRRSNGDRIGKRLRREGQDGSHSQCGCKK